MRADEAIILVGGRGTRLQSVISDVPKPLAPVAGRPFLSWVLDHLDASGIRKVILATGYMAEQVASYVGDTWGDMSVSYSVEDGPLGTGGAVRQASGLLQGDTVHILNGDTFLRYAPSELEAATSQAGGTIGVALARVDDIARYGSVVVRDDRVLRFREKGGHGPGLVNAGSYFFTTAALGQLERGKAFSLETEVLEPQTEQGNVIAFTQTSAFIDIGVPEDYERAQSLFGEKT